MRNSKGNKKTDLEECRDKINAILREYNCSVETDDYHWVWLRDKDTDESIHVNSH